MIKRICCECKKNIEIDKKCIPDDVLFYKNKYYHTDCFRRMCEDKINKPKTKTSVWEDAMKNIPSFIEEFKCRVGVLIDKDNIFAWMGQQYLVSKINDRVFEKLDQIYNGEIKGQAYAISPEELLKEWRYFIDDLRAVHYRQNIRGDGNNTILYDLSILVSWNARYREDMRLRDVANQEREREKATKEYIDYSKVQSLKGTGTQNNGVSLNNILDDFI